MYNFRYHLITICSIFVALALGLLLGAAIASSELVRSTSDDMVEGMLSRYETLVNDKANLEQELENNTALAGALSDTWAEGRLDGRIIVLLLGNTLEDRSLQTNLTESINQAGGSVVNVTVLLSDFGLGNEEIRAVLHEIVSEVPGEEYQQTLAKSLVQEWSYVFTTTSIEPVDADFNLARHTYVEPLAKVSSEESPSVESPDSLSETISSDLAPQTDFQRIIFDQYPLTRALLTYAVISIDVDYSLLIDHVDPSPPLDREAALKIVTAWQLPYSVNGLINGLSQQQNDALIQSQVGLRVTLGMQEAGVDGNLSYPAWLKTNIPKSTSGNVALPNYFTVLIQPPYLNNPMDITASENNLSCVTSPDSVSGRYSIIALLTGAQAGIYGDDRPTESRFAPLPEDTSGRAVFR